MGHLSPVSEICRRENFLRFQSSRVMLFDWVCCLLGLGGWCSSCAAPPGMPLSRGRPVIQVILNTLPPCTPRLLLCKVFLSQAYRCSSSSTSDCSVSVPVLQLSCSHPIVYANVLSGRTRYRRAGVLIEIELEMSFSPRSDSEIHVCHCCRDKGQMSKGRKLE